MQSTEEDNTSFEDNLISLARAVGIAELVDPTITDEMDVSDNFISLDLDDTTELEEEQKELFAQAVAERALRIAQLIQRALMSPAVATNKKGLQLKDLEVNTRLPLVQQYADIGLWRAILRYNVIIHKKMKKFFNRHAKQQAKEDKDNEDDSSQNPPSDFKMAYMEHMYDQYGEEIKQINKSENFDAKRLALLIDCLEAGVDIFSASEMESFMATHNLKSEVPFIMTPLSKR